MAEAGPGAHANADAGATQSGAQDADTTRDARADARPGRVLCARLIFKSSPLGIRVERTEDPCVFRLPEEVSEDDFAFLSAELDGLAIFWSEVDGFTVEGDLLRLHGTACQEIADGDAGDHTLSVAREVCPVHEF